MRLANKGDESLLLYLETGAVDHGGLLDPRRISEEERTILERWRDDGYVEFGRVASKYITAADKSLWVHLSEQAWSDVAGLRRARAERMWANRNWMTTAEYRAS